MSIVVDSNIIATLVIDMPYSETASAHFKSWLNSETLLLAPMLFEYEIATIIRRYIKAGEISEQQSRTVLDKILSSNIDIIPPSRTLHHAALRWAEKIGQAKAYDAHYLALAEQESADFWSADKRLVNNLHQLNIDWAHWIGEA